MRWTAKYWSWYKKKPSLNAVKEKNYISCNGKAALSACASAIMSMGVSSFKALANFESSMKQVETLLKEDNFEAGGVVYPHKPILDPIDMRKVLK